MFGIRITVNDSALTTVTWVACGQSMSTVRYSKFVKTRDVARGLIVSIVATTTLLITGSADNTAKLWEVKTGRCLKTWEFKTAVKRVEFSEDDTMALCVTEERMGYSGSITVLPINPDVNGPRKAAP